jgi:hypothetical protein
MRTIEYLARVVTGDNPLMPYRSGPKLVSFYNRHGSDEVYPSGGGFPSRWDFSQRQLLKHNGTPTIFAIIEDVFDPTNFGELDVRAAVAETNGYLKREGLELLVLADAAKVCTTNGAAVAFAPRPIAKREATFDAVRENIEKCEGKLKSGDYAGAITNARSLIEDVLREIEVELDASAAQKYDGDLPRLYKRVRGLVNLDPSKYADREDVVQILSGLTSVVSGLAALSNELADRHGGRRARADARHARLAVNAANTLCGFIVDVYEARFRNGGQG